MTVKAVSASPIIAERIRKDRLRVVGALYDLETGIVELTENVPKQFLPQGAEDTQA
jgi:carbonic anhydrase